MNDDEALDLHHDTYKWLETESTKYIRQFQLARTEDEREAARKKLLEICGRLKVELKALKQIMDGE